MIDRIRKFLNPRPNVQSAVTLRVLSQEEILIELLRARDAIEEDRRILDQTQEKLAAERVDPWYPAEALPQIDQQMMRNQYLLSFLSHDYQDWLDTTIAKLQVLEKVSDIDDQEFFRAFRNQLSGLKELLDRETLRLRERGLRFDYAELWTLSIVRRVSGHQHDALEKLPMDAVTLFRENS